jgi:tyrosine-specific transport protein
MKLQQSKLIGGILLVAGTTIGAGMLALPLVTGFAGFIPTVCLFLIYWCYMTFTAFLMLEVNLWLGERVNLITMARKTLGRGGETVAWITYLFLLYLLTTAYLAGGGPILIDFITTLTGIQLPPWAGVLPLLLVFGYFVYEGTKYVDAVNRVLMVGLAVAYILMVIFITPHIDPEYLFHADWKYTLLAVSLVATSFGYHIIIPTLTTYMNHNVKDLKLAILIGSLIPLGVYILWEGISLGVIPVQGEMGIVEGYKQGASGVKLLSSHLNDSKLSMIAEFFSFFAIVTSFLGVTLSLSDFLSDGLKIKKTHAGRLILFVLTFTPPLIFIFTYPRAFLTALEFAGAFGVIVLLGLLPAGMAWAGRYHKGMKSPFTVPGGKISLIAAMLFSLLIIGIEIANKTGLLEKIVF